MQNTLFTYILHKNSKQKIMFSGVIKKMISINGDPIRYMLDFENDILFLNQFIGKNINLKKKGYCCLSCSENIEIFANGFCKKCFFEKCCFLDLFPECSLTQEAWVNASLKNGPNQFLKTVSTPST